MPKNKKPGGTMNLKKIKKKEKKEKRPKVKKLSQQKANKVVFTGVCLLVIASTIGVIRANVVATNFDQLSKQVDQLAILKKQGVSHEEAYDYSALSFYVTRFAKEYLNMDTTASEEEKSERLKRLSNYLSIDVESIDESSNQQLEIVRQLKEASLSRVLTEKDCLLVYLNVSYESKQKDKIEQLNQEMVLPIKTQKNLFSIVGRPYFLGTTLPQGKTEPMQQDGKEVEVTTDEKANVEKFLKLFFEKYATANKQELMLLMKEPVITTGDTTFLELKQNDIRYFETKQKGVQGVQVSVSFADKSTGLVHTEDFTLWLSQTENSYFVNTLKHYFTEKEGN